MTAGRSADLAYVRVADDIAARIPGLPSHARRVIAATEMDAEDYARIVWTRIDQAARLHLYLAAGGAIESLASTCGQPVPVLLPPITDHSFRWR